MLKIVDIAAVESVTLKEEKVNMDNCNFGLFMWWYITAAEADIKSPSNQSS